MTRTRAKTPIPNKENVPETLNFLSRKQKYEHSGGKYTHFYVYK